jgi:hypothetical protein
MATPCRVKGPSGPVVEVEWITVDFHPQTLSSHSSAISAENRWNVPFSSTTELPQRVQLPVGWTAAASEAALGSGRRFRASQWGPVVHVAQLQTPAAVQFPASEQLKASVQAPPPLACTEGAACDTCSVKKDSSGPTTRIAAGCAFKLRLGAGSVAPRAHPEDSDRGQRGDMDMMC